MNKKKKLRYSLCQKAAFYASYFFYKLLLPLEVKKPALKLWVYEWLYTIAKFKNYSLNIPWFFKEEQITTRFGSFIIRKHTSDAANVSPAFERRDQNYLLRLIRSEVANGRRVLFLDIGADLGTYSVLVANQFSNKPVTVYAFEPMEESCRLIEKNIALNNRHCAFRLYPLALLDKSQDSVSMCLNASTPGSSSLQAENTEGRRTIRTETLDRLILNNIAAFDTIVFKIDVEGVEQAVLQGGSQVIASGKRVFCMVEDFIVPAIIPFMENSGWSFLAKVTSYNSWWHYDPS
ncbi:MAG: FkbM family methyltransferase [Chitinivibrionales bacterium]|nr:FkbM family methyltransferase [Chitinivibrionales bacterium]